MSERGTGGFGDGRGEELAVMKIVSQSVVDGMWEVERAADECGLALMEVMEYCQMGLVQTFAVSDRKTLYLDEDGLYRLRQIHHLREIEGVNLKGIPIIVQLLSQLQQMDHELRFLRER